MTRYIIAYISTLVVFLGLDFVWLTLTGDRLYKQTLGDIMLADFKVPVAAVFYVFFIIGIQYFAVVPALDDGRWTVALLRGALFGFFTYATYDFTNQATLRNWTWTLTFADLCWGTFVTAMGATAGFLVTRAMKY